MEELLSLENDFIRRYFSLEPAAFKLLSFCHFAAQGRSDINIESQFSDIENALNLGDGEVLESLDALVQSGLVELAGITEESFTYRVNLPQTELTTNAVPSLKLTKMSFSEPPKATAANPLIVSLCRKIIDKIEDPTIRGQEAAAFNAMMVQVGPEEIVEQLRRIPPTEEQKFVRAMTIITEKRIRAAAL